MVSIVHEEPGVSDGPFLQEGRPFYQYDLESMPDDGRLAVEVLSPSTRQIDVHVKRERFERAGCPSFWVVDPMAPPEDARLVAWQLGGDKRYEQIADIAGEQEFRAMLPYPVTVVPAALVR
jgi:Uma2 family endonuclease